MRQTSGRSYSTHGAFNRCQVAGQQWLWSKEMVGHDKMCLSTQVQELVLKKRKMN